MIKNVGAKTFGAPCIPESLKVAIITDLAIPALVELLAILFCCIILHVGLFSYNIEDWRKKWPNVG
jgi:hypothetical protein